MDILSPTASVLAVVSVAVQLADSVKKLSEFWNSVREAPEDVRALAIDVKQLSSVLIQIASEEQHSGLDANSTDAVENCALKVKTLTAVLDEIEPGFASRSSRVRQWTAIKTVLKKNKIKKCQKALDRMKSTLVLAQLAQVS